MLCKRCIPLDVATLRRHRCDSFNTVQLQILSDTDPEVNPSDALDSLPSPPASDPLSPDASRPASPHVERCNEARPLRRARNSASAIEEVLPPVPAIPQRRIARSQSLSGASRIPSLPDLDTSDHDAESMDTGEDYDDVAFWGGQSPRERARDAMTPSDDESGDDGIDEDGDQSMTDDLDVDDDDDDDDHMEIFGHR